MLPLISSSSYSTESINEVCTSTASLSVSVNPNREYHDSPTVVSQSSSSHAPSDQFEDAPEDDIHTSIPYKLSDNPLDALAMACGAAKKTEKKTTTKRPETLIEQSQHTSFQISRSDVLCGRGGLTNHHPGNVFFRRLVRMKQESYLLASKREKAGVAKEIVESIRNLNPQGRFLKKDPQNPGHWIEIGDRKAREKTSQALREGAPELREELQSAELQEITKQQTGPINNNNNNHSVFDTLKHGQCQPWPETPMSHKPMVVSSHQARVVSSDSIGVLSPQRQYAAHYSEPILSQPHIIVDDQPLQHLPAHSSTTASYHHLLRPFNIKEHNSQPYALIGNKRKWIDSGITHLEQSQCGDSNGDVIARGPRLKLLKQRLRDGMSS